MDEVAEKVRRLNVAAGVSVRTALVYDGRLSPRIEAEHGFDVLVPAQRPACGVICFQLAQQIEILCHRRGRGCELPCSTVVELARVWYCDSITVYDIIRSETGEKYACS